jgi:prolyl-tRNA synthetase
MTAKEEKSAISPRRSEDFSEWYQQVVRAAELAENSPVRGCMVIKPWGFTLWENMQRVLDKMFKDTGHRNAYFPLLIPKSYLEKEAEHIKGFATECAVVTHTRLEMGEDGKFHPASPLEEPLVIRPTSETIIGEMYSRWVQSYRDLPLLINQWANVMRWEMRTRLFLRTSEFLWQEGHTVHASSEEALEETHRMLKIYANFCEQYMAVPVIQGEKTDREKFAGAETTLCIEAMMQDRKALQSGTSHYFGQKFAKASNISYLDENGDQVFGWTTSWGVSTRLVGGLVMVHSDDDGLIIPPRLAPTHVVILPIIRDDKSKDEVLNYCEKLSRELKEITWDGRSLEVELDDRDIRGGDKMWQWIKKGVPLRVEVGPRDIAEDKVFIGRRDKGQRDRFSQNRNEFISEIGTVLNEIQNNLLERAKKNLNEHTVNIDSKEVFYEFFTPQNKDKPEIHGGFAMAHWSGDPEIEEEVQKDLGVSIRCIPFNNEEESGNCVISGKPSNRRVVWGKGY